MKRKREEERYTNQKLLKSSPLPVITNSSPLPCIKQTDKINRTTDLQSILAIKKELSTIKSQLDLKSRAVSPLPVIITQQSVQTYPQQQQPRPDSMLSSINIIVYNYPRSNPSIVIESGSIFNSKCSIIVNSIGCDINKNVSFQGNLTTQIISSAGYLVRHQMESSKPLIFNSLDKTYSIIITDSGNLLQTNNIQTIFHVHLDNFDYINDTSEIHFKNTIVKILKLAVENNCESIAFPSMGCGELLYPSMFIVRWFDEVFKTFFLSYTCHSLKLIKIILFDNDRVVNSSFNKYFHIKENILLRSIGKFFFFFIFEFSKSANFFFLDTNKPNDDYQVSPLDPNSEEFRIVVNRFKQTMMHASIKHVWKNFIEF
jgi:O-acetyl-ADP-ribose deacetylase (regulator of RNase III)